MPRVDAHDRRPHRPVDQPTGPTCTWDFAFDGDRVSLDQEAQGNDACYGHGIGTFQIDGDVATFAGRSSGTTTSFSTKRCSRRG